MSNEAVQYYFTNDLSKDPMFNGLAVGIVGVRRRWDIQNILSFPFGQPVYLTGFSYHEPRPNGGCETLALWNVYSAEDIKERGVIEIASEQIRLCAKETQKQILFHETADTMTKDALSKRMEMLQKARRLMESVQPNPGLRLDLEEKPTKRQREEMFVFGGRHGFQCCLA